MLYVFHGSDVKKCSEKARILINSLRAKKADAAFVPIDANSFSRSVVEEHLESQGLFSNKYIIFLNRVTENKEASEIMADLIFAMQESPNIFIALEGVLKADIKKLFDKHAEKIIQCDGSTAIASKKEFNAFALADALGSRDSFKAWTLYRTAIENGIETEKIIGTVFWQVKSMIVANRTKTVVEAGLNPFVFGKSKKYAGNFKEGELEGLLRELIALYHDGHRGIVDMETGLERFILNCGKTTL